MRLRSVVTFVLALLVGCGGDKDETGDDTSPADTDVDGDADTDADADADADADTDSDADTDTTVPPTFDCADEDGGNTIPLTWTGTTAGAGDDRTSYCSLEDGGLDHTFLFTAPSEGTYVFESAGTEFVAILSAFDGCGGYEAICEAGIPASLVVPLAAGQQALIGIDGYRAVDQGAFSINGRLASPTEIVCDDTVDDDVDGLLDCIDPDCSGAPSCAFVCPDVTENAAATVVGTTVGAPNEDSSVCDGAGVPSPDWSVGFVAPEVGTYGFLLSAGTTFDTILTVYDTCGGTTLDCADLIGLGGELVIVDLEAGDEVVAVIDGYAGETGDFELSIITASDVEDCVDGLDDDLDGTTDCVDTDCVADPACIEDCTNQVDDNLDGVADCVDPQCIADAACASVCPEDTLSGALPIQVAGSNYGASDDNDGCVDLDGTSDVTYEFTATAAGNYTFDTLGSPIDTVLYVLDGCAGASLGCNDDQDFAGGVYQSEVTVALVANQTVIVVVDTYDAASSGSFVLNVQ